LSEELSRPYCYLNKPPNPQASLARDVVTASSAAAVAGILHLLGGKPIGEFLHAERRFVVGYI
jgi:hypothetical protein